MDYLGNAKKLLEKKDYMQTLGLTYDMSIEELEWWIELAEKLRELLLVRTGRDVSDVRGAAVFHSGIFRLFS